MPKLDQEIADKVGADGLPRVAVDEEGGIHVLYLDGGFVRSTLNWPPPLPTEPTPEESAAAMQGRVQQAQQDRADAVALRTKVRTTAQSAVGVIITDLTAAQVRALLAVLLWKAGALDKAGVVRPLDEWV